MPDATPTRTGTRGIGNQAGLVRCKALTPHEDERTPVNHWTRGLSK